MQEGGQCAMRLGRDYVEFPDAMVGNRNSRVKGLIRTDMMEKPNNVVSRSSTASRRRKTLRSVTA
jgi:hypothetical protein